MSKAAIKIKEVYKNFGSKEILKNISLEVKKGEIYGIIGVSGSGKSTLLNIITGLISQNKGEVYYNLEKEDKLYKLSEKSEEIKKLFGYSFQRPAFHSRLTVQENLEHFSALYGIKNKFAKDNANSLLNLVELKDAKNILGRDLPGGMQKRLCFACSLIHSPKILFLDEPTSNLDPLLRRSTMNLLRKINENGTTIIISSQLLRELDGFCDRLCIIDKGKIIKEGTIDEIKKEYTSDVEIKVSRKYRLGDIRHNYADLSKIKNALGFSPKVNFKTGIRKFVKWVQTQDVEQDKYEDSIKKLEDKGLIK